MVDEAMRAVENPCLPTTRILLRKNADICAVGQESPRLKRAVFIKGNADRKYRSVFTD